MTTRPRASLASSVVEDVAQVRLGGERHRCVAEPEPGGAHADLRRSPPRRRHRSPARGARGGGGLQEEGGLADAGIAAERIAEPGTRPPPSTRSNSPMPESARGSGGSVAARSPSATGARAPCQASGRQGPRRGPPPPRWCSTRRRRRSGPTTWHGRRRAGGTDEGGAAAHRSARLRTSKGSRLGPGMIGARPDGSTIRTRAILVRRLGLRRRRGRAWRRPTRMKPAMLAPSDVVAGRAVLVGRRAAVVVDGAHDLGEPRLGVLEGPASRARRSAASRAREVATPPAFAALPGPNATPASRNTWTRSGVHGMFAPSATARHPVADERLGVLAGRARSASRTAARRRRARPRSSRRRRTAPAAALRGVLARPGRARTSLISLSSSRSMPSSSTM